MTDINNAQNVLDSRDVIARLEDLQAERANLVETLADANDPTSLAELREEAKANLTEWDEENGAELTALKELAAEGEGCSDWNHGETLIRDSYFETYAEELAADIGALDPKAGWPLSYIDWEAAADALKMDYTAIDFDGVTYWVRS